MVQKYSLNFYLAAFFSLIGLIFPTRWSELCSYGGDPPYCFQEIRWAWGFYIRIPHLPEGNGIQFLWIYPYSYRTGFLLYVMSVMPSIVLTITASFFILIMVFELLILKYRNPSYKKMIYYSAIFLIISVIFYFPSTLSLSLSLWSFTLSAIFAIIGNKKMKKNWMES